MSIIEELKTQIVSYSLEFLYDLTFYIDKIPETEEKTRAVAAFSSAKSEFNCCPTVLNALTKVTEVVKWFESLKASEKAIFAIIRDEWLPKLILSPKTEQYKKTIEDTCEEISVNLNITNEYKHEIETIVTNVENEYKWIRALRCITGDATWYDRGINKTLSDLKEFLERIRSTELITKEDYEIESITARMIGRDLTSHVSEDFTPALRAIKKEYTERVMPTGVSWSDYKQGILTASARGFHLGLVNSVDAFMQLVTREETSTQVSSAIYSIRDNVTVVSVEEFAKNVNNYLLMLYDYVMCAIDSGAPHRAKYNGGVYTAIQRLKRLGRRLRRATSNEDIYKIIYESQRAYKEIRRAVLDVNEVPQNVEVRIIRLIGGGDIWAK